MAFSKAKQYQQTSSQAHQEEKREDPNKIRNERGKITTDTQKYKKIIRHPCPFLECEKNVFRVSWDEVREWHGHIYTTKCKTDS